MSEPLLRAEQIARSFGRRKILRGVTLEVAPGTLVGIVGENGAGKSTLLRILAGELRPHRGTITRSGWPWSGGRGSPSPIGPTCRSRS